MKNRNGFVSNSSSSSFVVWRKNGADPKRTKFLTKAQEKKLKKAGFHLAVVYYPHHVDESDGFAELTDDALKIANWARSVICNQEDEIYFLLKNRFSFMANVHYDHYSMIYDGPTDQLLIAQNYGKQAQMNGIDKINFTPWRVPGLEKTTGKEYIKKHNTLRI